MCDNRKTRYSKRSDAPAGVDISTLLNLPGKEGLRTAMCKSRPVARGVRGVRTNPPSGGKGPIIWKYGKGPGHSIRRLGDF